MIRGRFAGELRVLPVVLAFLLSSASLAVELREATGVGDCQALVQADPDDFESYRCFWVIARGQRKWDEAARALEGLLAVNPEDHRARLYLAAVVADLGQTRAETLYAEAAAGFARQGPPRGEVYARLALAYYLRRAGRPGEAGPEIEAALGAAERSGEPELIGRAHLGQASQLMAGADYGKALSCLDEAEKAAFPSGPFDLRTAVLSARGRVLWALGLHERALDTYERESELYREAGDHFEEAGPRYNMALMAREIAVAGRLEREAYRQVLNRAVDVARSVGHRYLEARSRLLLGRELEGDRAIAEYRRVLAISKEIGDGPSAREAKRAIAETLAREGGSPSDESFVLVDEAIREARLAGDVEDVARGRCLRAWISGLVGDRQLWMGDYARAFDAVERIRDLQPEGTVRARVFARWTFPYYRFADRLLVGLPGSPDPDGDMDKALRAVERMRARVLLDELDAASAGGAPGKQDADHAARAGVIERIATVQSRLVEETTTLDERLALIEKLERLEMEERALRDAIARKDPRFGRLHAPVLATVAEIRTLLAPDQAVLSFHLSTGSDRSRPAAGNAGSWLIAVTKDDAHAFRLPDRDVLEDRVAVLLGLFIRRDGSDAAAAQRFYADLLSEASSALDPKIRRLVIVPDGRLHRLPFAALIDGRTGRRLGESHEITVVPSLTLWARWKRSAPDPRERSLALILADPALGAADAGTATSGVHPWRDGLDLDPLPGARREARAIQRSLGRGSRVLLGQEAAESVLKRTTLDSIGLLHLATHAVVDEARPERSAVVLASGNDVEDGLLQIREIVELDLNGAVVVLTGCRSASGSLLAGEGPLGLARGFFQAGAHTVVGSVWPLRDDDAERFAQEFGFALARGESIAAAVQHSQRVRIAAGDPVEAWAGMVVLGDGDLGLPKWESRRVPIKVLAIPGLITLFVLGVGVQLLLTLKRRRDRQHE